jgi:hypothetical protein
MADERSREDHGADERSREDHAADPLALGTADSLPHRPDRRSPGVPVPTGMGFRE